MSGLSRRDAAFLCACAALPAAAFLALRAAGRSFYWGDLVYLHFAWRVFPAQAAQSGALPLWDPYNYLGMPGAAAMQGAPWHPLTLPFHLAGFATGLSLFYAAHAALAAALWFLALRSRGMGRGASAAGTAAALLGGVAVSHLPLLNHVGALTFLPGLLLFAGSPAPLALTLALSFLEGYPPMTAGTAAAAFLIGLAERRGRGAAAARAYVAGWAVAAASAAALAGVLLLPALELVADSRRAGGLDPSEALTWSWSWRELPGLVVPLPGAEPTLAWWKVGYQGAAAAGAAVLGAARLGAAGAAGAAAWLAGTAALLLGSTTPFTAALWTTLPPLRFVRYPGNMTYLLVPLTALLCARGLQGRRWAPWGAVAVAAELAFHAAGAQPTAPASLWTDPGAAVATVRALAGGHRFLISPRALHAQTGGGPGPDAAALDLKHRLYGLTGAPYRLESATGFGEPLVPSRQYAFIDFIQSAPGADAAARWMPWADAAVLLTPEPAASALLEPRGTALWAASTPKAPVARAWWFPEAAGAALPAGFSGPPDPSAARPLSVLRAGAGRFETAGEAAGPGWVFLSEPLGRGWRLWPAEPAAEPALGAFVKVRVPAGRWRLVARYDPLSFRLGLSLTLVAAAAFALWARGALAERAP